MRRLFYLLSDFIDNYFAFVLLVLYMLMMVALIVAIKVGAL